MTRILTHDEQHAATLDKLALVANPFDAGTNFHNALDEHARTIESTTV